MARYPYFVMKSTSSEDRAFEDRSLRGGANRWPPSCLSQVSNSSCMISCPRHCSSFTSTAAVVNRTRRFCRQAATHRPLKSICEEDRRRGGLSLPACPELALLRAREGPHRGGKPGETGVAGAEVRRHFS